MNDHDSERRRATIARRWTSDRQAGFISLLFATGCVAHAAAAVGMSREGAYRLRARDGAFAEGWDVVLALRSRARQAAHRRPRAADPAGHTWGHTPRPATTTKGHTASAGKGHESDSLPGSAPVHQLHQSMMRDPPRR